MRERTRMAPPTHAHASTAAHNPRFVTPQYARARHDRGTRRARACIAWMLIGLCIVSVTPRAWYASYIDVFGEKGDRTIGERIEERIRMREATREAARAARAKEREGAGFGFGWLGTRRASKARAFNADGDANANAHGVANAGTHQGGVDEQRASTLTRVEKVLSENEKALVESLKARLGKVNAERDSIIYLMRKIKGEEMDNHHELSSIDENGEINDLTDDEIASAMAKLEEIDEHHQPLLKRLFG